ncbi:ribonuclease P protein component 4 [Methanomethylovorans sp.]|uniref:ribonuclease P protein component 4 n=1 Tax=Methanomethylovorans sp. TaxID=2758717 RepID=UPI00351C2C38
MSRFKKKSKNLAKDLAMERIQRLFELADAEFSSNPIRSDEYVLLARKIGMRYLVRFPRELKVRFCKSCGSYLVPGGNCRIRLKGRYITITCLKCGNVRRYIYHSVKTSESSSGK